MTTEPIELPEPAAWRFVWLTFIGDRVRETVEIYDASDPPPLEWDDEPPDERSDLFTVGQLRAAVLADRERIKALEAALTAAINDIGDWGLYASDYFREKHGLDESIATYRAILKGPTHD